MGLRSTPFERVIHMETMETAATRASTIYAVLMTGTNVYLRK